MTTSIQRVDITDQGVHVVFDRCDQWPPVTPPGWGGPLKFTLWLFEKIGDQWYGSGIIQFWSCDQSNGGAIYSDNQIARNWVYDNRWSAMVGHQPAPGEIIGFMVSAGNARGEDDHIVQERSDIVSFAMPLTATVITEAVPPVVPPVAPPAVQPPPTVVSPPVTVDLAYTNLLIQQCISGITTVSQSVEAGRTENRNFFAAVGSEWRNILKYAAPVVGALVAGLKLGHP